MSLASDLMGLGVSPLLAARTSQGGIGPLTISAAGTAFASATRIGCTQYLCSCSNADGTKALALPLVGTDNGALLADDFVVNNLGNNSLPIYASSGVTISGSGSNTATIIMQAHTSLTCYPISTTQWIAVKGS